MPRQSGSVADLGAGWGALRLTGPGHLCSCFVHVVRRSLGQRWPLRPFHPDHRRAVPCGRDAAGCPGADTVDGRAADGPPLGPAAPHCGAVRGPCRPAQRAPPCVSAAGHHVIDAAAASDKAEMPAKALRLAGPAGAGGGKLRHAIAAPPLRPGDGRPARRLAAGPTHPAPALPDAGRSARDGAASFTQAPRTDGPNAEAAPEPRRGPRAAPPAIPYHDCTVPYTPRVGGPVNASGIASIWLRISIKKRTGLNRLPHHR